MIWFILFIIIAALTIAFLILRPKLNAAALKQAEADRYGTTPAVQIPKWPLWIGVGLSAVFLFLSCTYTQDPGEAKVLKSATGEVIGSDVTEGFSLKLPWVDPIDYDIRNQQAAYVGNGNDDYNGKKPDGSFITVRDGKGVGSDVDIAVRYPIREDKVEDVYRTYGSQENFKSRLISNDIRSVVRNAPAKYVTIDMLNKRQEIEAEIFADLENRWAKEGVRVESVALLEIRPPKDVSQSFSDAQNAQTQVVKAQAELEATKISSQQRVVQAEAEAKANSVLAASLTEPILRQRYLDKLGELAKAGNVVMVPSEGGNTFNLAVPKE